MSKRLVLTKGMAQGACALPSDEVVIPRVCAGNSCYLTFALVAPLHATEGIRPAVRTDVCRVSPFETRNSIPLYL